VKYFEHEAEERTKAVTVCGLKFNNYILMVVLVGNFNVNFGRAAREIWYFSTNSACAVGPREIA
jgi:hypothetical protein